MLDTESPNTTSAMAKPESLSNGLTLLFPQYPHQHQHHGQHDHHPLTYAYNLFTSHFTRHWLSETRADGETIKSLKIQLLSRARRACALSARAVTGRQCPHSGEGGNFFDSSAKFFFFTKTAITMEMWKWTVDQNWGRMAKIEFFGQKPRFRAQKKG